MAFSYTADDCDIADFARLIDQSTDHQSVPLADHVDRNIPIYDAAKVLAADRETVLSEWCAVLKSGPGVFAIKSAFADTTPIDQATALFTQMIADEKAAGAARADHFSAATNDRVWNALQKLCLADPPTFAAYFGNPVIDLACTAWLGPNYQMTTQINLVHPGGVAQTCHRDYHLGFQAPDVAAAYPHHVHDLSAVLTLQGAIAHCDMPVESGPTKLLPFSQTYAPGYAAYRLPAFQTLFEDRHVQIPLAKGDALFFNPALFHAAGANQTKDIQRMANLLQVSSAFGRAMETIDRRTMCDAVYPVLQHMPEGPARDAVIAATAEGYSFPTNLDRDPPVGGAAPQTQAALTHAALDAGLSHADYRAALARMAQRQGT